MLYAGDIVLNINIVLMQHKKADLHHSVYRLYKFGKCYNLKILTTKTKVNAHHEKYPVKSKIVIENKVLEQVSSSKYFKCDVSRNLDQDVHYKINKLGYNIYVELYINKI